MKKSTLQKSKPSKSAKLDSSDRDYAGRKRHAAILRKLGVFAYAKPRLWECSHRTSLGNPRRGLCYECLLLWLARKAIREAAEKAEAEEK